MKSVIALILALTFLVVSLSVSAQTLNREIDPKNDTSVYAKETDLFFENDYVNGSLKGPTYEKIDSEDHPETKSLIITKQDFINEMLTSVHDL